MQHVHKRWKHLDRERCNFAGPVTQLRQEREQGGGIQSRRVAARPRTGLVRIHKLREESRELCQQIGWHSRRL